MSRIFFFLFGFGLMTVGFIYLILYLNMLNVGYNFYDYVHFIIKRIECYFTIIGLVIMNLAIYIKGDKRYGIYL